MEKATLEIDGISSYNLNLLNSAGIPAQPIKLSEYHLSVKIPSNMLKEARAVLEKHNRIYREKGLTGLKRRIVTFLTSYTLIAGMICGAVLVWLYSSLVTDIEVAGLSEITEESIISAVLHEEKLPVFYDNLDNEKLRNAVLNVEGIAGATVRREGTRIIVTVSEELPKVPVKDSQTKGNIVALTGGVVTKIVVVSGTAKVKAGDTVRPGTVLVESAVYDAEGNKTGEVVPEAIVEARVWYSEILEYPDRESYLEQAARDVQTKKDAFTAGLPKDKIFITYWVKESSNDKSVDKNRKISIYFEVIQSIAA